MSYRKKIYYPESQIEKNLYTNGKEWMTIDDWKEYIGLYHKYVTGEVFTGANWNPKLSRKLVRFKNRPDDFFKYIDIKNYKISNGEKKEIIGNGVIHVSRYRAPRAIKRKPTDQELLNGSMTRYFIYKRNEPKRVFFEISEEQAKSYKKKTIGINDNLYGLIEFLWKIDGSERDIYENGILIDPGVYDTNERIILRMSKKFPILAEMITNYFEYTVYE